MFDVNYVLGSLLEEIEDAIIVYEDKVSDDE